MICSDLRPSAVDLRYSGRPFCTIHEQERYEVMQSITIKSVFAVITVEFCNSLG